MISKSDHLCIEGQHIRTSAVVAVLVGDKDPTQCCVWLVGGQIFYIDHSGDDPVEHAKRTRDSIALHVWPAF